MRTKRTDPVLVVGAGPTGLLLAAELARHGAPVRIVDRRPGGCGESRALGVQARTLEMLDGLGLADELMARGTRVRGFSMWDGRRLLARVDYGELDSTFPFLLDVPQSETEAVLRAHLERLGVAVEACTEVLDLEAAADGVEVTARGPGGAPLSIRTPYVVGCDGAHSAVRRRLGLPFVGHAYADGWLLADVALEWDRSPDDVHIVFHASGRAVVCMPMGGGRWRVILYFADRGDRAGPPALAEVADLVAERVPGPVAVSDPSWLARFQTHRRSAPAYRVGRVLLAGDAVHVHSPAGGQGMNTGLLEAHNLGWKLAAVVTGAAREELLDTYQAERAPVARDVLALTHRLVRLSSLSAPWQRAARAAALPVAARLPGLRRRMARRVSQLSVGYRGSPGSGDRVPDVPGLVLDGRPARLHELLRGPWHTLLVLSEGRPLDVLAPFVERGWVRALTIGHAGESGAGVAVDATGEVRRRLRSDDLLLVRPDGHVAARGLAAIERYLTRLFRS